MTVRRLICVCGSSVALGLTSATAQDTTTTNRQNDNLTNSLQTGSAEDVNRILEQRQGVWRVDVMVGEGFWGKMGSAHSVTDQRYITPGQRDTGGLTTTQTDRVTPPADQEQEDPANPWFKDSQNQQRDTPTTTQTDRTGQTGQTTITTQPGMKHLSGYAECDVVLGENVLHERIVVPRAGEDLGIPADDRDNLQTEPAMTGGEGFRGITMISFNQDSKTYDMVMLSNQHEGIKYDTGIYDAQRNRVIFRGGATKVTGASDWKDNAEDQPIRENNWQTDPSRDQTDPQNQDDLTDNQTDPDRYNLDPTPSTPVTDGQAGLASHHNIVVVLEVVDDNTQRVTMYDASASSTDSMVTPSTEWDKPITDDTDLEDDLDDDMDDDLDDIDDDLDDIDDDLDDVDDDLDDVDDDLDDVGDNLDDDADVGDDFDGRKDRDALKTDPTTTPRTPSTVTRTQPTTTAGGEFGKIIYQATYTRADSSMEASIRSMIDREIVVASR